MSPSQDSELPEPDSMTVDPANLGSVDPHSVEGIFLVALSKSGPERDAFLSVQCVDPSQRQRVEGLLQAYEQAGNFLEKPAVAAEATPIGQYLEQCALPGTLGKLGPYEILEEIGRGGMGVVFRAHDPKLQRIVAVKALAPELARLPSARQRFLREARAAAAVSHPHVVTIFAVEGTEEASLGTERTTLPYLVMECIVGQTLHDKIKRVGALKVEEIVRISRQIAEGLTAAHKRGLIHRDIKPANVLLENGVERVKITDFGLARTTSDGGITHTGEILGTPQCMSPEQARGEIVDQRSDLFSLGCVMYTMCTGVSPFRADNMLAVMKKICETGPRPIAQINPNLPEWLCELVHRLLEKEPEQRVQTAGDVVETLENHSLRLGIRTDRSEPVAGSPTPRPNVAAGLNLWQRVQWQHWLLLVLLISGLIGVMVGQNRYSHMLWLPVWGTAAWAVLLLAKLGLKVDWSWINWRSAVSSVVALFCGANLRAWLIAGSPRWGSMVVVENFLRENAGLLVFPLAIGIFWLLTRLMPWGFISPHPPATQPLVNQSPAAPSRSPWSVLGWMLVAWFGIGLCGGLILAIAVIVRDFQAKQALSNTARASTVALDTHGQEIVKAWIDGNEVTFLDPVNRIEGRPSFLSPKGPHIFHVEYASKLTEDKFFHGTVDVNQDIMVVDAPPTVRPAVLADFAPAPSSASLGPSSEGISAELQGEWLVTDGFHHVQGIDRQFDDEFELLTRPGSKRSFVIRNDQIWHRVEFNRKDTNEPYRMDIPWGKIVLHADGNRHAIDLINENDQPPETKGLYQIDGDRLQLAIAVDSETNSTKGMPRPKALLPGKDVIYFECERTTASGEHANPGTPRQRLTGAETPAASGVNSVPLGDAVEVLTDPSKMPEYTGGLVGFSEPRVRVWIDEPGLIVSLKRLDFEGSEGSALMYDSRNTWGGDSFRESQTGKPAEVPPGRYQVLVQDLDYGWSVDQRGTIQIGNGVQTVHVRRRFHEFTPDGDGFPVPFRWAANSYQITNTEQIAAINGYLALLSGKTDTATADPQPLFNGQPLLEQIVTRELEGGWALAYLPPRVSVKLEGSNTEVQFRHSLGTIRWSHSVPEGFKVPGAGISGQVVYRNFRWPNAKPVLIEVDPFSEAPIVVPALSRNFIKETVMTTEGNKTDYNDALLWFRRYSTYMSSQAVPAARRLILAWANGKPDVPEAELLDVVKEASGDAVSWENLWQVGAVDHHLMTAILEPGSTPGTWRIKEPPEGALAPN